MKTESKRVYLIKVLMLVSILAVSLVSCSKKISDKDNKLYVALRAKVKGLDPVGSFDFYSNSVKGQIYDSLFQYHYRQR